jgi:hypothetical protein
MQWTGGALGSTVDRRRRLAGARHVSTRSRRSSPVVAKGDEGNEAVPEGRSLEHISSVLHPQ